MALAWLLLAWATAFVMAVAPAFMPPSWTVLAAFAIGADVPVLPLTLGAAVAGGLGRLTLTALVTRIRPAIPERDLRNAEALGRWFDARGSWKWPAVALFVAGPFPSNALFIAAGAGRTPARPLAAIYAVTRSVTDTAWVWAGVSVAASARGVISDGVTDWRVLAGQAAGLVAIVLVFRLPWARWLGLRT